MYIKHFMITQAIRNNTDIYIYKKTFTHTEMHARNNNTGYTLSAYSHNSDAWIHQITHLSTI